jgi:8-oxo-dGTP pyrophosphatase MutT (NUDIX family)
MKNKKLSSGIVLQDKKTGKILSGHSTGKSWQKGTFDIPKGRIEDNENALEAVIRECKEETGIDLTPYKEDIIDCGVRPYTTSKNLHMFYLKMDLPDIKELKCESYFKGKADKMYAEINGYKYLTPQSDEIMYLFKVLVPIVEDVLEVSQL